MNNLLLFDFSVDKENKTIKVTREFAADLDLVWDAWTKAELLEQWWAPEPYKVKTKTMDFREGGYWLYAMVSPENTYFWSRVDYQKIEDKVAYSHLNGFSDENGMLNTEFGRSEWNNRFEGTGENTTVYITIQYDSLNTMEKMIQMGFKGGFSMGLSQLEKLLQKLTVK